MILKLKRIWRWIMKGVPERKVFISTAQIVYGEILIGKTALVTGGGSGIGRAIAYKLHQMGAKVLIIGRNEEKLRKACEKVQVRPEDFLYQAFDLTDFEHLEYNLSVAKEKLGGKINILISNAGIWKNLNITSTTYTDWDRIMDINLKASFFIVKYVVDAMGEGDSIIVTGSENAQINVTNPYTLSKAALHRFVGGLAKEYNTEGIRVNGVAPGPTISEINPTDPNGEIQRGDNYRTLLAEEIAEITCFLASPAAKCINGQVIYCDEGDSLR